jgi:hypothetical protein
LNRAQLIDSWKINYDTIKEQLIVQGSTSDSLEYNLLACEALCLHECILALVEMDG